MEKCPTCGEYLKDHRYDLILHIAESCQTLREFDDDEKMIYPEYEEDNANQYLINMTELHDLTDSEVTFILKY